MKTTRPDIEIRWVCDEHAGGTAYAYTVGLAAHDLPELHLWAKPSEGDDRGDEWELCRHDLHQILDDFSNMLLDGQLGVGATVSSRLDHGVTELRFRLDPPVPPDELHAFDADPSASVVPVRWSLHRPEPGPLVAAPEVVTDALEPVIRRLMDLAVRDRPDRVPDAWRLPEGPYDFAPDQRFGPLTPWVAANAAAFATATARQYTLFCENALITEPAFCGPSSYLAAVELLARPCGRESILDEARRSAGDLVGLWRERVETNDVWRTFHKGLLEHAGLAGGQECAQFWGTVERALYGHLAACVVWDALSEDLRRYAFGPWAFARFGDGPIRASATIVPESGPAGVSWEASELVKARIADLLVDFDLDDVERLVAGHDAARGTGRGSGCEDGSSAYQELFLRLAAWAMTGAATLSDLDPVLKHASATARAILTGSSADQHGGPAPSAAAQLGRQCGALMQRALSTPLTALVSAVVHRERLDSPELTLLIDVFEPLLPGSRDLLLGLDDADAVAV